MPFKADFVGAGYDTGTEPVSGLVNIADGPAISNAIGYAFSIMLSPTFVLKITLGVNNVLVQLL